MKFSLRSAIFISSVLLSISCCAGTDVSCKKDIEGIFSKYSIVKVEKYGGGLATEKDVKEYSLKEVIISKEIFQVRNTSLRNPKYKIRCYPGAKEGEVDKHRWANFYGYGGERDIIEVLEVYDINDKSNEPYFLLEIINGQEIWEMYDGWIYMMRKTR